MDGKATAVHVTHEAVGKIGGIGAVLQGLFTSNSYLDAIERSILVGPLFSTEGSVLDRLGEGGEVLYSSIDELVNTGYASAFRRIENFYNTNLVYGRKKFVDPETDVRSSVEVLLVDVRYMDRAPVNELKKQMFERFDIHSDLYEDIWEFEQYVRLAPVAITALKAIEADPDNTTIFAHEFMGMPTALAAICDHNSNFQTVFHAHEVATMRRIVENHPGHDTMFYNALEKAHKEGQYVNDVFGDQNHYFKHTLVEASKYCDCICAVGDFVAKELRFMAPEFESANINVVYNGIPANKIDMQEKLRSRERLRQYCDNLLGFKPDYVFTHVTRLVQSKGLWRDLKVLEHMEQEFHTLGKTGVMLLLSTEVAQRRSADILRMERDYKWPVAHREGNKDLSGGEAAFYTAIQEFNARSRNIKVVFVNQFGFERRFCGERMSKDMEFMDIRKGSDVEFGLSIYEPFGIAQLEPLSFGGICVVTNVCGCAGFVQEVTDGQDVRNVIIVDYTNLDQGGQGHINNPLEIDDIVRNKIENNISGTVAMQICSRLATDESQMQEMVKAGYDLAKHMSWEVVVQKHLLKSLEAARKRHSDQVCSH